MLSSEFPKEKKTFHAINLGDWWDGRSEYDQRLSISAHGEAQILAAATAKFRDASCKHTTHLPHDASRFGYLLRGQSPQDLLGW